MKKLLCLTTLLTLIFGTTQAFSENIMPISVIDETQATYETTSESFAGKVTDIAFAQDAGAVRIVIQDDSNGLIVNAHITDKVAKNNMLVSTSDVELGDFVTVFYETENLNVDEFGFDSLYEYDIIAVSDQSVLVATFDDNLLNDTEDVELIISAETVIVDNLGNRRIFTADDIKNKKVLVVYDYVMESFPAKINPSFVMVIEKYEAPADPIFSLRQVAENMGYNVAWQSNDEPILISNDKTDISVMVGESNILVNGEFISTNSAPILVNDSILIAEFYAELLDTHAEF